MCACVSDVMTTERVFFSLLSQIYISFTFFPLGSLMSISLVVYFFFQTAFPICSPLSLSAWTQSCHKDGALKQISLARVEGIWLFEVLFLHFNAVFRKKEALFNEKLSVESCWIKYANDPLSGFVANLSSFHRLFSPIIFLCCSPTNPSCIKPKI